MHTRIDLTADLDAGGRTRLTRLFASGQLAARTTGPGRVHLVGVAAGPLGGDTVEINLQVGPGAHLVVRSVAAAVVLAGRERTDSSTTISASVGPLGSLDLGLEPTIVTADASHTTRTSIHLHGGAGLRLLEEIQLGRHGEWPGRWTGSLHIRDDGLPVLAQRTSLGPGSAIWTQSREQGWAPRGLVGEVVIDDEDHRDEQHASGQTAPDAVRVPLPGRGRVSTAVGVTLRTARAAASALDPPADERTAIRVSH